jgi:hypothetical protein
MRKLIMMMGVVIGVSVILYGEDAVKYDEKYFSIAEVEIEKVSEDVVVKKGIDVPSPDQLPKPPLPTPTTPGELPKPPELPTPPSTGELPKPPAPPSDNGNIGGDFQGTIDNVNAVLDTIDKIVNLGQKVWEIIEKNQPVVNINVNYANAVPYGIQHWTQLQGWSKPKTATYSFVARNFFGIKVVKVTYQLEFRYNGNYQGKGKFLTGVTIEPISVETVSGYNVSLSAEVPDSTIANVGTHEDPIASMQVQLKWTIHTKFKDTQQKAIYYVQGDGEYGEIATPFKGAVIEKVKPLKIELPSEGGIIEKIKSVKF